MFCRKCGKEVQENWSVCPSCGTEIYKKNATVKQGEIFRETINIKKDNEGKKVNASEFNVRILLKALMLIALICFFCPLYLVSCAGKEVMKLSGPDLMFGFRYMEDKIDGNLIFVLLGLFPFVGVCFAFANQKKLELQQQYEKIESMLYSIAAAAGTTVLINRYFTACLQKAFRESAIEIKTCMALNLMTIASIIALAAAAYYLYRMETDRKENIDKGKAAVKCGGRIAAGIIVCFITAMVIVYVFGGLKTENISGEYFSKAIEFAKTYKG